MSDRYQFTVIMPNLNYDVPQDVPQDQMDAQIIKLISNDNKITTEKIAMTIGVSTKTVKHRIKKIKFTEEDHEQTYRFYKVNDWSF